MDAFFEYMVKRKKNIADIAYIAFVVIAALGVIIMLLALSTTQIASLVFPLQALTVYIAYRVIVKKNVEFEYCLTNDELDIDTIINKQKRKRIAAVNVKEIISMAPTGSEKLGSLAGKKIINVTSGYKDRKVYCMICGDSKAIFFEPRKNMVLEMQKRNPKNIFVD